MCLPWSSIVNITYISDVAYKVDIGLAGNMINVGYVEFRAG